ncbi:MAG: hypothetical protein ACPGVX_02865, partial [Thalassobaculaceae bacterium]
MSASADTIAAWVIGQHENGQRYQPLPADLTPPDLATAYQAQARLAAAWAPRRGPVAGYKIAVTSKAIQELCKMDSPCAGRLFGHEITTGPAVLSLGDYTRLGLEFELAVRVGQDLAPADGPWDADNVRGHVATVAAAIAAEAGESGALEAAARAMPPLACLLGNTSPWQMRKRIQAGWQDIPPIELVQYLLSRCEHARGARI